VLLSVETGFTERRITSRELDMSRAKETLFSEALDAGHIHMTHGIVTMKQLALERL
jgi:hypothetical protein